MRTRRIAAALTVLLAAVGVCALAFGSVSLAPEQIIGAFDGSDRVAGVIIFELRLPRLLAAMLAGAGLAVAGLILQTVTDNDLCAPNIIGVNSGAGFAVMLTLCAAPSLWRLLPLAAFAGALLTTFAVLTVARLGRFGRKSTLVLAGVAVSSLLSAGISYLSIKFPEALTSYTAFSVGGFAGVAMKQLPVPAAVIAVGVLAAVAVAGKLRLLSLGDETAAMLGVRVRTLRIAAVVIASALCASVVSFAGLLGFVGLIVPHIVRRFSDGLRAQIAFAALSGAILCVLSDLLGRTLTAPGELPAGIIMSFVGAPFFIFLLVRRKRRDQT